MAKKVIGPEKNRILKRQNKELKEENSELKKMQFHIREEKLELSVHDHNHTHSVTVSDLPPPEVLKEYPEELQSLILERIKADIDNDKALIELERNEQILRDKESTGELSLKNKGQWFAFSSLVLLTAAAVYFVDKEAYKIAGSIVAVTIVGSIAAFTGFNPTQRNNKDKIEDK